MDMIRDSEEMIASELTGVWVRIRQGSKAGLSRVSEV